MTRENIQDRVRQYITDNFLYMRSDVNFSADDSLLSRGFIDSMGAMELVDFIGEEFGVTVMDTDITEANLGTLSNITAYVESRLGGVTV